MFQVKAPESFKSTLTIVGHGREQKLNPDLPAPVGSRLRQPAGAGR